LACIVACSPDSTSVSSPALPVPQPEPMAVTQPSNLIARQLVDIHCVRCHLAPNPEDLSKENWPAALAKMSMYLGFKGDELSDFSLAPPDSEAASDSTAAAADYRFFIKLLDTQGHEHVIWGYKEFVLPEPLISVTDWKKIRDYFVTNAQPRAKMYIQRPKPPSLQGFTPTEPDLDIEPNGLVFATAVDEGQQQIYVGRSVMEDWTAGGRPGFEGTDDLLVLNLLSGKRVGYLELPSDPIKLELNERGVRVSTHGKHPFEEGNPQGYIADVAGLDKDETQVRMLVRGLHRTTLHRTHDMDIDGLSDIVVNTFGDGNLASYGGKLSLYWQTPEFSNLWEDAAEMIPSGTLKGALEETILVEHVGMISSAIADFNDDGKPDIVALMAQGLQQLSVFTNEGNRSFDQKVIKQYTPSWGFNMVYAADMDGDGLTDIVTVNGDNTDGNNTGLPGVVAKPKSYHGLRIYRNNGDLSFTEQYFYPLHGAIRAVIEDFDGDGDQDAAVIAMWADWGFEEPETFVYLENQGSLEFNAASLPTQNFGIWVSIEAADVNDDEKPDIVLGLANWPTLVPDDWTTRKVMEGRNGEAATITFLINEN
jgi:hypothetical protein